MNFLKVQEFKINKITCTLYSEDTQPYFMHIDKDSMGPLDPDEIGPFENKEQALIALAEYYQRKHNELYNLVYNFNNEFDENHRG